MQVSRCSTRFALELRPAQEGDDARILDTRREGDREKLFPHACGRSHVTQAVDRLDVALDAGGDREPPHAAANGHLQHGAGCKSWKAKKLENSRDCCGFDGVITRVSGATIPCSYRWPTRPSRCSSSIVREIAPAMRAPPRIWIARSGSVAGRASARSRLRGDTDFTQTAHLDRWDEQGVTVRVWLSTPCPICTKSRKTCRKVPGERLRRPPKYEVRTQPRSASGKRQRANRRAA